MYIQQLSIMHTTRPKMQTLHPVANPVSIFPPCSLLIPFAFLSTLAQPVWQRYSNCSQSLHKPYGRLHILDIIASLYFFPLRPSRCFSYEEKTSGTNEGLSGPSDVSIHLPDGLLEGILDSDTFLYMNCLLTFLLASSDILTCLPHTRFLLYTVLEEARPQASLT